ncbi:MAG: hypothetical protein ACKOEO_09030, partial [Planctomycetaceae bacterium]
GGLGKNCFTTNDSLSEEAPRLLRGRCTQWCVHLFQNLTTQVWQRELTGSPRNAPAGMDNHTDDFVRTVRGITRLVGRVMQTA